MRGPRVCVVGGGFAGVQAARRVAGRCPDASVTLIDRNNYATMVPALPDVLSGRVRVDALAQPLTYAVGPRVRFLRDSVERIDLVSRSLHMSGGTEDYDYLVIATGSTPLRPELEADDGHLYTVHSLDGARTLRQGVETHLTRDPDGRVVIVGAGYTGLEVASCLRQGAELLGASPRITVVEIADTILGFLAERERSRILSYFESIDVDIRTGTALERYASGTALLSDGSRLEGALICWAAGMQARTSLIEGGVERTRDGRIRTTATLQLPAHPEVFVAGDAAALEKGGKPARRAVNFAYYSGRRAGENVAAAVSGRKLREFRPVDLGWIIPLGEESVGRIFGAIPTGGALGLRLHYTMCGFRRFAPGYGGEFYRTATRLSRTPDPLAPRPGGARVG